MNTDCSGALSPEESARAAIESAWVEIQHSLYVRRDLGVKVSRLPDISEAAVESRSVAARRVLLELDALDVDSISTDLSHTVDVARYAMAQIERESKWYWLVADPSGNGFFTMFSTTAYSGGFLLSVVKDVLSTHRFDSEDDVDRYLQLVEDYGRLIDQMRVRTAGQALRGIRMPRAQLDQAVDLVERLASSALTVLSPNRSRLHAVDGRAALSRIEDRFDSVVAPAFVDLAALLADPEYRSLAPETVGLGQYPGGSQVYEELTKLHATVDLTPREIHERGCAHIEYIRARMQTLLDEQKFSGSAGEYVASLDADPKWRADSAADLQAVFRRYIDRITPHIANNFRTRPAAPHDAEPLSAALAGSMTFGFYQPPTSDAPAGKYFFNTDNLRRTSLAKIASLNYHELVPGHHFHMATQRENESLHPLRGYANINAFAEGWAEYAATLAGEIGMYQLPQEQFGRLIMDAFLTCRLVVDTGMNALGWSLAEARDYMRENSFISENEILSETVRYSCDMPAQALAYKLGEFHLMDCREEMRTVLGERFDIRDFHDAVLRPGALPLSLVEKNVRSTTQSLRSPTAE